MRRIKFTTALKAFSKQSAKSKKADGIGSIIIGCIAVIIGIALCFSRDIMQFFGAMAIFFGIVFLIMGLIAFAIGSSEQAEQEEYENKLLQSNMNQIDNMDGVTFEEFLAALFKKQGYSVELTKASGDYGVDLILKTDTEKIIVQAKRYANKVSLGAVQEISAARSYYNTYNAWVVTNNYFTSSAINLANANGIKLIDRKELAQIICETNESNQILENDLSIPKKEPKQIELPPTTIPYSQKYDDTLNVYNNDFSNKIHDLQQEIIAAYGKQDKEKVYALIKKAESIPIKSKENKTHLHFFYQEIINIVYALRHIDENAISDCLSLCDKDIAIVKEIHFEKVSNITSLTRKAIIYEKQNNLEEAIKMCDFGIENEFLDNGKPFNIRKERLLKKLNKS